MTVIRRNPGIAHLVNVSPRWEPLPPVGPSRRKHTAPKPHPHGSASGELAGLEKICPRGSKRELWQGSSQVLSAPFHCTMQPRCGQTAESPWAVRSPRRRSARHCADRGAVPARPGRFARADLLGLELPAGGVKYLGRHRGFAHRDPRENSRRSSGVLNDRDQGHLPKHTLDRTRLGAHGPIESAPCDHGRETVVRTGRTSPQPRASARSAELVDRTHMRGWRCPVPTTVSRPSLPRRLIRGEAGRDVRPTTRLRRLPVGRDSLPVRLGLRGSVFHARLSR